jgi:hypothetical protein
MGNIIYANPDENVIGINHCVFPFQMEGYGEPKKPFVLCDYHGRGFGVTASYTPELGLDVTLGRFDTMLREFVFTKGELVDWGEDYCRTNLKIHVSDVRGFIRQVRGNHHIVVYGDWTNRIRDLCGEFGIETVGI